MKSLLLVSITFLLLTITGLAQTKPVKLQGQIVCSQCWFEQDRTKINYGDQADLDCAKDCAAKNIPAALAVKNADGKSWTLYSLENGAFKKPEKDFLKFMAKEAEISGVTRAQGDKQFLKVDALKVLADSPTAQAAAKLIGTEAELALKDLFGVEQKLSALRGRVVILNFWATWCGPCKKEMPDLAALQNEYAALGVQVIGATADTSEKLKEVRQFIKDVKLNFPVWLGATTEEMARFGLGPALPGTAIIGRDGKIVAIFNGVITAAEVKKKLDELIAKADKESKDKIAKAKSADVSSVPS